MTFEGIYVPVITPFHPDYTINEAAYAEMIEHLLAQGIHGLVIGGTTGENYALTPEERVAQFKTANALIKGRVPWIAGVNDIRTEQVCDFAAAARDTGAAALLLAIPPTPSRPSRSWRCTRSRSIAPAASLSCYTTTPAAPAPSSGMNSWSGWGAAPISMPSRRAVATSIGFTCWRASSRTCS